ncbi:hypothetical protein HYT01_04280 [Candidatus Giovannonibacteria bacterium]|nr:hypothetical protein [Candidatus Giovannonibacteria bacterium]
MKNKKTLRAVALSAALVLPLVVSAQNVQGAMQTIQTILNAIIPILMIIATIVFLWGVIKYITAGGDEEALSTGRSYMIFGLIGLTVMVAVWGIVTLIVNTFGVGGRAIPLNVGSI